jgi:branched-chain amino acid transport system substrate-binding protein
MRQRKTAYGVVAVLVAALAGCSSGGSSTLTIANFDPFSGPNATYGFTEQAGCVPAVNLINAAGGILGKTLTCKIVDDRGDPADAVPAAQKLLATTPDLIAVVDANSGLLSATTPLFNTAHIPELSLGGDVPFDKSTYEYFWRTIPGDDVNGYAVAAYIKSKTSYRRVASMFSAEEAAQGNVPGFTDGAKRLGLTVSVHQDLAIDQPSYQTEIHKMVAETPQVMAMESDAQTAGVLYGQMKQSGSLLPTVLTAGADNADFDKAVVAAIGEDAYKAHFVKVLLYTQSSGPAWETFDKALMSAGSAVKDASEHEKDTYSEAAYDNVNMIALAALAAKSTDPKVFNGYLDKITKGDTVVHTFTEGKAALDAGKTIAYQGATGVVAFDKYHNNSGTWGVFEPLTQRLLTTLSPADVQAAQNG